MRRNMINQDSEFWTGDVTKMRGFESDKPIANDNFPYGLVIMPVIGGTVDFVELDENFAPLFPRGWNEAPEDEFGEVIGVLPNPKQARYGHTKSMTHRIEFKTEGAL